MKSNHIYVNIDSLFEDKLNTKSGVTLYNDTSWNPEWGVTAHGIVRTAPKVIKSNRRLTIFKGDTKQFGNTGVSPDNYRESDIYPDVQVGDKIYFRYTVIWAVDSVKQGTLIDGELLYYVPYKDVFCIVRDGDIIPVGSHVLMEAVEENKIATPTLIIPEALNRAVSTDKAIIRHIGKPLKGASAPNAEVGDLVVYSKRVGEAYTIEGKEYVIAYHDDLMLNLS